MLMALLEKGKSIYVYHLIKSMAAEIGRLAFFCDSFVTVRFADSNSEDCATSTKVCISN